MIRSLIAGSPTLTISTRSRPSVLMVTWACTTVFEGLAGWSESVRGEGAATRAWSSRDSRTLQSRPSSANFTGGWLAVGVVGHFHDGARCHAAWAQARPGHTTSRASVGTI